VCAAACGGNFFSSIKNNKRLLSSNYAIGALCMAWAVRAEQPSQTHIQDYRARERFLFAREPGNNDRDKTHSRSQALIDNQSQGEQQICGITRTVVLRWHSAHCLWNWCGLDTQWRVAVFCCNGLAIYPTLWLSAIGRRSLLIKK
jgi:hypothetical protein